MIRNRQLADASGGKLNLYKIFFVTSLILTVNLFIPISNAVYGGEEVSGSERVVVILESKNSRSGGCSGALITSRIVLTAAHCLGKPGKYPGVIKNGHWGYWISQPGVDFKDDNVSTRVQSSYVVITDDYTNSYDPATKDYSTTIHDIAFIFLRKPIEIDLYPKIASKNEVMRLKAERAFITHFGYGLSDKNVQTGKPKKVVLKIRPRERSYELDNVVPEVNSIITDETGIAALCGGDSGGPWYAHLDGQLLIVANTVGASGCTGPGSGRGGTFGTLIHPYESLLWKKWEYFLANESEIVGWETKDLQDKEDRVKALKENGQYYQELTGCHSNGIQAYLQSNISGSWQDVASVEDWIYVNDLCHQPWAAYRAVRGELLRWRLNSPGAWEVFTNPIQEKTSVQEAKTAAELKAKQEAEAKAAADKLIADAKIQADKILADAKASSTNKRTTIICFKGKVSKKVTAIQPKCPSGFKVKK